jgi:putative peptidoglycan lipid II flippase
MLPVMVSTWIQPLNVTINTKVASGLFGGSGEGVAALNFANTLYTVIMGVFILSVANLVFPRLAKQNTRNDRDGFGDTLYFSIHAIFYFMVPMTAGLVVLAEPLVRLVFEVGGRFDAQSTRITARALTFYCVGITGFGVQTILARGFYALKDGITPLVTSVAAIAINLVLSLLLVESMDVGGVALASSVSISAVAAVMIAVMSKNFRLNMWRDILMMICAAAATAFIAAMTRDFFLLYPDTFTVRIAAVFVPAAVGAAIYLGLTWMVGVSEARVAVAGAGRFLKRRG